MNNDYMYLILLLIVILMRYFIVTRVKMSIVDCIIDRSI